MKNFEVYYLDTLIGNTFLENGDAPMGVAHGLFVANSCYKFIKPFEQNKLSIKYNGDLIPCEEGVLIKDYSKELNEIHITIAYIPYPLYEEIFPEHVYAYKKLFLR